MSFPGKGKKNSPMTSFFGQKSSYCQLYFS